MPSLYTLSLFTTLASNKSISRRLVGRQDKSIGTGFQPGRVALGYATEKHDRNRRDGDGKDDEDEKEGQKAGYLAVPEERKGGRLSVPVL